MRNRPSGDIRPASRTISVASPTDLESPARSPNATSSPPVSIDYAMKYLKSAMIWDENGQEYRHDEAYNFGRSLIPYLERQDEEHLERLVQWLKGYEEYRNFRPSKSPYSMRENYVKKGLDEHPFVSMGQVKAMVEKQAGAYQAWASGRTGWRQALEEAGIFDDGEPIQWTDS